MRRATGLHTELTEDTKFTKTVALAWPVERRPPAGVRLTARSAVASDQNRGASRCARYELRPFDRLRVAPSAVEGRATTITVPTIITRVRIEASAPTRIDLAGGTLDIWPLYLFHDGAQTLNAAISLRARCSITPRTDRRLVIESEDTGSRVEAEHWSELRDNQELRLLGRLLHFFQAEGLELRTRCESPVGAGIAGSSALNIAVCAALAEWSGIPRSEDDLMQIAMNVEAQAIDVPTGVQDYRPALYGGISAVELRVDGVRRVALPVAPEDLEQRLVLAYTNASRNSGINNWEVTKRHIDGDRTVQEAFGRIRDIAAAMRHALERRDWNEVGRQIAGEWDNRKKLAPGVTTSEIDAMLAAARSAGALGGKVCGAGGGGCLFCIGDPADVPAIRQALADAGARVLDFRIERQGLTLTSG
jgi:D-glycero-alpha-D-manno-heptose-7-phosphate kinase